MECKMEDEGCFHEDNGSCGLCESVLGSAVKGFGIGDMYDGVEITDVDGLVELLRKMSPFSRVLEYGDGETVEIEFRVRDAVGMRSTISAETIRTDGYKDVLGGDLYSRMMVLFMDFFGSEGMKDYGTYFSMLHWFPGSMPPEKRFGTIAGYLKTAGRMLGPGAC